MTRRRSLAVVAVAAVGTVALAVGIAQGSSGSDGDTQVATIDAAVEAADVRLCPGAAPVDQLDPGATIALTGRSEDGAWLQLRSPSDDDERVWIESALVVVTTTPEDLPIVRCGAVDLAIELIGGAELTLTPKTTTTTTTAPPAVAPSTTAGAGGETTTTETAGGPTTTAGGPTPPTTGPRTTQPPTPTTTRPRTTTTRPPTTTTTTRPPDLTPPVIESFERSASSVFEGGSAACGSPTQVQLSARIVDASGLSNVRLIWRVTNPGRTATYVNGNYPMQSIGADVWRGTVGPVGQVVPNGVQAVIEWRVQAFDGSPARNTIIVDAPTNRWPSVVNC